MHYFFATAILLLSCFALLAQAPLFSPNLVPNPGFEESHGRLTAFTEKGQDFGAIMVDWHTPNRATTDLISPSFLGRKLRHTVAFHGGEQMVGLSVNIPSWGEYASVELSEPLKKGEWYYGEFWFFLSLSAKYQEEPQPFNRYFGMAFDQKIGDYSSYTMIHLLPDVYMPDSLTISPGTWVKIGGKFQARSDATHLHIGQFRNPKLENPILDGYFFLDDVYVGRLVDLEEPISLDGVFFDFNSANLRDASRAQLNAIVDWLRGDPAISIAILGHTDDVGDDTYNLDLSVRRAQAVVDYLERAGVAPERMRAAGMGETMPLVPNTSEANRQRNRRVELVVE